MMVNDWKPGEFAIKHMGSGQVKEMLLLQRLGFLVLAGDLAENLRKARAFWALWDGNISLVLLVFPLIFSEVA